MKRITRRAVLGTTLAMPFITREGFAQQWPAKPIRFICAFAAGGAADTVSRVFSAPLSEILGQSVVVENRTGGNAMIAANATLQAAPDGYTFLVDAANQVTNPLLLKDIPFDYQKAFTPISRLVDFPQVVAVKTELSPKTIEEYVALAKEKPDTISYGTPPAAGMGHFAGEVIQQRTGIRLIHAPYRGGADAARDIAAGSIDSCIITTSSIRPPLTAGRVRVLAVTSKERSNSLPDVPTLHETIMPGFAMTDWNGLFAHSGVPMPIVERMQAAVKEASKAEIVRARLDPLGAQIVATSGAELRTFLDGLRTTLAQVIAERKITIN
jgi:tripartite-type tricarboxylate transporter receptor subunit TctC